MKKMKYHVKSWEINRNGLVSLGHLQNEMIDESSTVID